MFFSCCVLKKILHLLLRVFGKHQRDEAVFARRGAGLFGSDFSFAERKVRKTTCSPARVCNILHTTKKKEKKENPNELRAESGPSVDVKVNREAGRRWGRWGLSRGKGGGSWEGGRVEGKSEREKGGPRREVTEG